MKRKYKYFQERHWHETVFWNILLFLILIFMSAFSLFYLRKNLLKDMRQVGRGLVMGYSMEQENSFEYYENLLNFGVGYIAGNEDGSNSIKDRLEQYFEQAEWMAGEDILLEPYVVVDEKVIGKGDIPENPRDEIQKAICNEKDSYSDGKSIYTDAYYDSLTNKPGVTILKKYGKGDILAFDVSLENFWINNIDARELPRGSAYYICDSQGAILYQQEQEKGKQESDRLTYLQDIYPQALKSSFALKGNVFYVDTEGTRKAMYACVMQNGWYSILAIPEEYIMRTWYDTLRLYIAVYLVFILLFVFVKVESYKGRKKAASMSETLHILANSCFALYRLDVGKGTYEIIKISDFARERLPVQGDYSELVSVCKQVVVNDMGEDLAEKFSLANIKKQIDQENHNFGGDFLCCIDGKTQWYNVRLLFATVSKKDKVVISVHMVDAEKQWQLQRQELLEEAIETAESSVESQRQFFANMSHDMRTPLNVILGMSELAENHLGEQTKLQDYLEKIKFSGRQLLMLINDILEVASLERGIELEKEKFNMRTNIEEYMDVFRTQASQQRKHFLLSCKMEHEEVYGDVRRLDQVLQNLLSNAIKFTDEGGTISVKVSEKECDTHVIYQFEIADTGIGMSEKFLKKIFAPYERERRLDAKSKEGTGLGMPIVRHIVGLMGGEINVESKVNQGTRFTITIPFEFVCQEEREEKKKQIVIEKEMESEQTEFILRGKRILLVEDYELNMELATELLEEQGAIVLQARNGKEAVEAVEKEQPYTIDAVLMDMQMPVMDGCEAARAIRGLERPDCMTLPIIALTANAYAEDIVRTERAGMDAHVSKPIDMKVLCNILTKLMKKGKRHDSTGMLCSNGSKL